MWFFLRRVAYLAVWLCCATEVLADENLWKLRTELNYLFSNLRDQVAQELLEIASKELLRRKLSPTSGFCQVWNFN